MCGQFDALLGAVYEALIGSPPTRAVAPTVAAPVIVRDPQTGQDGVMEARFGLVPHWHRGTLAEWKATSFNARLEEVANKPAYRGPWTYRHCVVPAACFYEWSGAGRSKRKYRVTRADNQIMAFAGLWDEAVLQGAELHSFTLLTRPAGPDMAAIHDREPCVLGPDAWDDWLACRPVDLNTYTPLKLSDLTPAPLQGSLF